MNNKGFTLIEMLVVIAVVGILAATVITSIGPARSKAKDSRIRSAVNQIRSLAEANYNAAEGKYDAITSDTEYTSLTGDIEANDGTPGGGYDADNETYYFYSSLASDSDTYFCVDSAGNTYTGSSEPTGPTCPSE